MYSKLIVGYTCPIVFQPLLSDLGDYIILVDMVRVVHSLSIHVYSDFSLSRPYPSKESPRAVWQNTTRYVMFPVNKSIQFQTFWYSMGNQLCVCMAVKHLQHCQQSHWFASIILLSARVNNLHPRGPFTSSLSEIMLWISNYNQTLQCGVIAYLCPT